MSDAISTYQVTLQHYATSAYSPLVEIKDFPDLGGDISVLDKTTLSENMRTYIPGIQDSGALEFTANYNLTDYQTLVALRGTEEKYAVYFGSNGADGKFLFDGYLDVHPVGAGVNEVVDMKITIAPSSVITFSAS